jgi:protein TonB
MTAPANSAAAPVPPVDPHSGVVSNGWLAPNSTFEHRDERKLGRAAIASLAFHGLLLVAVIWVMSIEPAVADQQPLPPIKADLVYLDIPGPGGGGGGSPQPAPPKKIEIPKMAAPPPTPIAPPVEIPVVPPPPVPQMNVPVMTNATDLLQASGISSVALATNLGGGGRGTGIGAGKGNGLGDGEGGGTGGGFYEPGAGIINPTVITKVEPKYTSEAMRAKTQGEVWLDCVIGTNGLVIPSSIKVAKSLDRVNGLDQAAIAAAKQWLFRPGTKQGVPVAVHVTLILEFRLH